MRHDPTRARSSRTTLLVALALVALAIPASPAAAAVTIDDYLITANLPAAPTVPTGGPSILQAGGYPNAGSYTTFSYPDASEDLKTALTNFAPGLLGNPESVPKCSEAALQAGGAGCPAGSAIGTSRLDARVAGTTFFAGSFPGTLYNAEPLGNEPGRLGVVTPTAAGTLVSSIPFTITPRGARDYGLTGTLTDINRLPAAQFGTNLQVRTLAFIINGETNKYVRNPTSCRNHTSTGEAIGYDDPAVATGPPYTFSTGGCDALAFAPKVSLAVGDRGTTKLNGYPPFVLKITQGSGEADVQSTKITLPVELNTNNSAYKLCTEAQADVDACPKESQFGGVVAKSPFLSEPLAGPIYLTQQSGSSLPGLLLDLYGRAHVKIHTSNALVNNKRIQSLTVDSPQLPISELTVALNGGRNTGVFQNRSDLCFRGSSTTRVNSVDGLTKLAGWNGKTTGDVKLDATVVGCGPTSSERLTGAIGSRPSLRLTAAAHPDSPNVKELQLTFSRNLSLVRSRIDDGASGQAAVDLGEASFDYVNRRTLRVTGLPAAGVREVALRLRNGAIRVSKRSRNLLRQGRSRKFRVKVRQTPVSGSPTSTRGTFTVKGR